MAEKPILFSGPMVRAILAGRKTQTRRVVKSKEPLLDVIQKPKNGMWTGLTQLDPEPKGCLFTCRYGSPGDTLWVRETWLIDRYDGSTQYAASHPCPSIPPRWKPSIHMPRNRCRLELEVTGVRIERLQSIKAKDIMAEGAVDRPHVDQFGRNPVSAFDGKVYLDLVSLWSAGWDSINGKTAPWASNPWVWVVEFRKNSPASTTVRRET